MPNLFEVIRRPLITEKGLQVKETEGTLVFDVAPAVSARCPGVPGRPASRRAAPGGSLAGPRRPRRPR